ncbi:MAG TPA: hypothetical protein VL137_01110 [Polyangiaceae bacterium]|nr:hypothetical protein [Polyangiaceae bacterium]
MKRILPLAGLLLCSCFSPGNGREPPLEQIYFPVGLALSSGADRLYVVNSDFDLQFNAGTLMALDAKRIRQQLPQECQSDADCSAGQTCDTAGFAGQAPSFWCMASTRQGPCGALGEKSAADRALEPGRCNAVPLTDARSSSRNILLDTTVISAFATEVSYRAGPAGGGRLFIPVRGDATLHWADVEDELGGTSGPMYRDSTGKNRYIDCGQAAGSGCDDDHRRGDSGAETAKSGERLPIEPYAVAVSDDGEAIVTTHQTTGQLALFVNDWCHPAQGPKLVSVLSDLPTRPIAIAPIPIPTAYMAQATQRCDPGVAVGSGYQPGFLVNYQFSQAIQVVRYMDAAAAAPAPATLVPGQSVPVGVVPGFDARGLALEGSARHQCEAACQDEACQAQCAAVPLGVYLANRTPAGLLIGRTAPSPGDFPRNDLPDLTEVAPLRGSPSRVVVGSVIDEQGQPSVRVFVVTFDTRFIYIYDPAQDQIEARVYTGRGPHGLAIDAVHGLGYVGHFTDSYIGVIDLDRRHRSYGEIVLSLGQPTPPRSSE